jgi:hypothetical protein
VRHLARWQSGYAEDCKSFDVGSIPARASTFSSLIADRVALAHLMSAVGDRTNQRAT